MAHHCGLAGGYFGDEHLSLLAALCARIRSARLVAAGLRQLTASDLRSAEGRRKVNELTTGIGVSLTRSAACRPSSSSLRKPLFDERRPYTLAAARDTLEF
jgi:hypothetical protein